MTGQITDKLIYDRKSFEIVGIKGEGLYTPDEFDLTPVSPNTANWRGYKMTYKIYYNKLEIKMSYKIIIKFS